MNKYNARKWKHENGGIIKTNNIMIPDIIKFFNGGGIPMFQESGKINRYTITPMSRIWKNQNGDFEEQQGTFEYDSAHDIGRRIFPNDTTLVINPYDQHYSVGSPSKPNGNTYTDQKFWDQYNEMFDWLKSNQKNIK